MRPAPWHRVLRLCKSTRRELRYARAPSREITARRCGLAPHAVEELPMIPGRFAEQLYAVMRIVFGLVFLMYGLQKFGMRSEEHTSELQSH